MMADSCSVKEPKLVELLALNPATLHKKLAESQVDQILTLHDMLFWKLAPTPHISFLF